MVPLSQLANTLSRVNRIKAYKNLAKLIGNKFNSASDLSQLADHL